MHAPRLEHALALALAACATSGPIEQTSVSSDELKATQAFELGGVWTNLTSVCVETDGTVTEPRTKRASGDPILDQLYLDNVARWRYSPQRSRKCQDIYFAQNFGPERSMRVTEEQLQPVEDAGAAPVEVIMAQAIHKPEPPGDVLAALAVAKGLMNWTFVARTYFCVEPDGTVSSPITLRSTGVLELDRVARATVSSWRFSPFIVGGQPTRVCSEVRFNLRFGG